MEEDDVASTEYRQKISLCIYSLYYLHLPGDSINHYRQGIQESPGGLAPKGRRPDPTIRHCSGNAALEHR